MTKKKPDFFTGFRYCNHGRAYRWRYQGNAAGLVGTLTQIKEINTAAMRAAVLRLYGKVGNGKTKLAPDEVTVVFAEDVPYRACNGIEFDVMQEFVEGQQAFTDR